MNFEELTERPTSAAVPRDHWIARVHQLSNIIQVIAGVLAHRRRGLTDPVACEQIEWAERIVRSLIPRTTLAAGDGGDDNRLRDHIGGWREAFEARSIALEMDCDLFPIPSSVQIPLILIADELLMNAFKHAFREQEAGRVRVSLKQTDTTTAELTVADDGVGLPANATRSGSGTRLLDMLAEQIAGTLTYEADGGLAARLRFPLRPEPAGKSAA